MSRQPATVWKGPANGVDHLGEMLGSSVAEFDGTEFVVDQS